MIYTEVQKVKDNTSRVVNETAKQKQRAKLALTQFEESIEELAKLLNQRIAVDDDVSSMDNK